MDVMDFRRLRVGQGFDSHRFIEGRRLRLAGVDIPYDRGLDGHSDADAVIHAVIDALLGGIGFGSIGELFPPDNPKYKDADSIQLLLVVNDVIREQWDIVNIDATIIAQQPRLNPFISRMRATLAAALQLEADQVGLKAKTAENMGALGRVEGIAVLANALLYKVRDE